MATRALEGGIEQAARIQHEAGLRIAGAQRQSGHGEAAAGVVARERERGRQAVVEVAERVGRVGQRGEEILEGLHLRRSQRGIVAKQAVEGRVEGLDAGAVAAPVEGFVADDVLQGLRGHRTLHRMEVLAGDGAERGAAVLVEARRRLRRVAEVPGQPVHAPVDIADAHRGLAQP